MNFTFKAADFVDFSSRQTTEKL